MAGTRLEGHQPPAVSPARPAPDTSPTVLCLACRAAVAAGALPRHHRDCPGRSRRDAAPRVGSGTPTAGSRALLATRAAPCTACGTRASELEWTHVHVSAAEHESGIEWSGWISRCPSCGRGIDAFHDAFRIA